MNNRSSRIENIYDLSDSFETKPNFRFQTSRPLDTLTSEVEDDFEEVFGVLTDLQHSATSLAQPSISLPSTLGICCETDKGQSSGTVMQPEAMVLRKCQSDETEISEELKRKQIEGPKRSRSAEVHNLSEKKRRARINKKLRTLQDLAPNCDKTDRASMLDDTIKHVKTLKQQVEVMQMFQAPYMSPTPIQTTELPQFSQFVPIKQKFGMGFCSGSGMASMCCTAGLSMLPIPAAGLHPSLARGVGFSLLPTPGNLAVPQMQMPFVHPQQLLASFDTSGMIPNFVPGFSPAFGFSGQVESGSQTNPSSTTDQQLVPTSQAGCPSVSSSTMPM